MFRRKAKKKVEKNPYVPGPCTVLDVFKETGDTFSIKLDMKIDHDPGQFVQVSIPGIGECPISICSDSREFIMLNIRAVGNVTKALEKVKAGDVLLVRGPYGKGYLMDRLKGNEIIMVGGGCGIAPLKGIIEYVKNHRDDYRDVHLFFGYRSPKDIIFRRELEDWRNSYNLTMTVDKNEENVFCHDADVGFITDALKNSGLDNENKVVFLCGPPIMMKIAVKILLDKGFHDDQIFVSSERLMYCGIGVCCHCMIRGKYTCVDGPVFRYDEIKGYGND